MTPLMWALVRAPGGPEMMMVPFEVTVLAWQPAHFPKSNGFTPACAGVLGGTPWHDPQKACELPSVHTGVRSLPAVSAAIFAPPPWQ